MTTAEILHTKKKLVPKLRFPEFKNELTPYKIGDITQFKSGGTPSMENALFWGGEIPWISAASMTEKYLSTSDRKITPEGLQAGSKLAPINSLLLLVRGSMLYNKIPIGIVYKPLAFNQDVKAIISMDQISTEFLYQWFLSKESLLLNKVVGTGIGAGKLDTEDLHNLEISLPIIVEQQKIAAFLSAVDERIRLLTRKKELLEQYKKGVMQQLFSGKLRFKDENGKNYPKWEEKKLAEVTECLDNRRIPLNSQQRDARKGDIPYYGANNVMGYVNDFIFNETIVLLAEDGGYFDEYNTRPIAQISRGKSWVNNHAHVLKGKPGLRNEYLFYALVHKNILGYVNTGTRSKLNKSDMMMIRIPYPCLMEQDKIIEVLESLDKRIKSLQTLTDNTIHFKKGLLQQMFV